MIAFLACNTTDSVFSPEPAPNPFSKAPYIDGKITNIRMNNESDSIEEYPEKLNNRNKIHFSLSEVTDILLQEKNGSLKPLAKEDLKSKLRVRGWSSGIILDSYPAQSEAKRIVVIGQ